MIEEFSVDRFAPYWFGNFGVVMFLGEIEDGQQIWRMEQEGADWSKLCLGSFYIKPNYPGRSSHVCNGGFLVSDKARGRGVGRLMGECYLEYAPRLVRPPYFMSASNTDSSRAIHTRYSILSTKPTLLPYGYGMLWVSRELARSKVAVTSSHFPID